MFSKLPLATRYLLIANAVVFLLQALVSNLPQGGVGDGLWRVFEYLELHPIGSGDGDRPGFMPWQLVTYGFLHFDVAHFFFNMLALVMFGAQVEHTWGARKMLTYYLTCVVGAGLCQLVVGYGTIAMGGEPYSTVGASGGIFGLLLAYGMLFPHQRVMLLIPPVPMKARTLVIVYGLIELFFGLTGTMPGVAHFAHLGGMLFGWLLIRHWRRRPPPGRGGRASRSGLRIVN
ncbi:rhomboid family intramembrane serine protease [Lysobacter humi (ex Lee et al. 2017)]